MRVCIGCNKPMTERNQPKVEGLRVFQAHGRCTYCYQRARESGEIVPRKRAVVSDTHITCQKCSRSLPVAKFKKHRGTVSGYEHTCRFCGKLFERYGINSVVYEELYLNQEGMCAICPKKLVLYGRGTHIDHDHSCCSSNSKGCGRCVRGLLCQPCNLGLGNFRDSEEYLLRAVEYLKESK